MSLKLDRLRLRPPGQGPPLVIETPFGDIRIRRQKSDFRTLEIEHPSLFRATVGNKTNGQEKLVKVEEGKIIPIHRFIELKTDDEGELVGFAPTPSLRLTGEDK